MEELHKIHKDVPYGYWVLWLEPAMRFLGRQWKARRISRGAAGGLNQLSAPH